MVHSDFKILNGPLFLFHNGFKSWLINDINIVKIDPRLLLLHENEDKLYSLKTGWRLGLFPAKNIRNNHRYCPVAPSHSQAGRIYSKKHTEPFRTVNRHQFAMRSIWNPPSYRLSLLCPLTMYSDLLDVLGNQNSASGAAARRDNDKSVAVSFKAGKCDLVMQDVSQNNSLPRWLSMWILLIRFGLRHQLIEWEILCNARYTPWSGSVGLERREFELGMVGSSQARQPDRRIRKGPR